MARISNEASIIEPWMGIDNYRVLKITSTYIDYHSCTLHIVAHHTECSEEDFR